MDADRILHSRAYTRYIDKTQVFYLIDHEHISHRVLHVQLLSKIARTIGKFLRLNEDLLEAIALGHDIGHPPFGHDGERILSALCRPRASVPFSTASRECGFSSAWRRTAGLNLSLQVLDGILSHDGETHLERLSRTGQRRTSPTWRRHPPQAGRSRGLLKPMTLGAAWCGWPTPSVTSGGTWRTPSPSTWCTGRSCPLSGPAPGRTNGAIIYALVTDLIAHQFREEATGLQPRGGSPAETAQGIQLHAYL